MNRDDIIRMAREAGLAQWSEFAQADAFLFAMPDRIERFAALVAAYEREACARLCDEVETQGHALWKRTYDLDAQGRSTGAADCAAAIRERGEK